MAYHVAIHRLIALVVAAALLAACAGEPQTADPISAPPAARSSPTTGLSPTAPPLPHPTVQLIPPPALPTAAASPLALPTRQAEFGPAFSRPLLLQTPRLHGQDVNAAQQRLRELGYAQVGEVDGIYGPNTAAAV